MKHLSRVVWSEGMYLGPHHFQAQNRYFEDSIRFATSSLWYEPWGLAGCEMDAEALANGTVSVVHARGIFPDGLPFNMPECDPAPAPRNISELFPPTRDSLTVLLSLPRLRQDGLNCILSPETDRGASARYVSEARPLPDENSGLDEKPVGLGRKNIRFLLDIEPMEDNVVLPVARVMRDGSGRFIYDPSFVPPCVRIQASERLMLMLRRLIEILDEKSQSLSAGKNSRGKSWAEYSTRDIASFWMLHTVNSALAPLRHHFLSRRGHPEDLFVEMSRLAGALCTFALDSHPRGLPLYDHEHLDDCFGSLDRHIRGHLETIVPTNCIPIPLAPGADYFYEGEVTDQRCLDRAAWILGVRSPLGEAAVIAKAPHLLKFCSRQFVPELVRRALPGLPLTHLPVPPQAVSARVDTHYFSITRSGPCWDHIVKTRQVGVYVPGELPEPALELLVVLDA